MLMEDEKLIYDGVPFHGNAEKILREIIRKEGLDLIDNRALFCYDEWFTNGGYCDPWYTVCVAFAKKSFPITQKKYKYKDNVFVEIEPLENVIKVVVNVYDR